MSETRIVRAEGPEHEALERAGWRPTARSWAAQLNASDADERVLREAVDASQAGELVRQLVESDLDAVLALDERTLHDYPGGLATQHHALNRDAARLTERRLGFGAFDRDGLLLAMTYVDVVGDVKSDAALAETDFTIVAVPARGRGLATAVKAASVLTLLSAGVTRFRTGGSTENPAIIASNARLGYVRDEEWVTLQAPDCGG